MGKRVSVRRLNDPGGGPQKFTDTVGVLTSWVGGVLQITRKNGEGVRIADTTLVAGKVIPPAPGARSARPPVRRRGPAADAHELDRVAARGWPPAERARLAPPGADAAGLASGSGWELRAAGGFTRRANSVLPLSDPGLPLDEALRRVRAWYAERGLPAYVQVSTGAEGTQEALADELARRLWTREVSAQIWIAALAPLADRPQPPPLPATGGGDSSGEPAAQGPAGTGAPELRVELSRTIGAAWLARYERAGQPAPEVLQVLTGGPSVWFATVRTEPGGLDGAGSEAAGEAVAIGRCVVDGRWAGFTAVEVAPAYRRRGLASAVMAALASKALAEGASAAYLQVETDNAGAHALYDQLGFRPHHSYHHWRAPR